MIKPRALLVAAACAATISFSVPADAAPLPTPSLDVTVVRSGLAHPWAMTFLPDGSMLYTQRDKKTVTWRGPSGTERVVLDSPAGMWSGGETGLMGIETSVDFATTGLFFTCHGYRSGSTKDVRVVAWKLDADRTKATFSRTLVPGLPTSSGRHGGCALQRRDGFALYIGTGDAAVGTNPQKLTSGGGKVLRVSSPTGNGYSSNPYGSSKNAMQKRIWSYGHRNVQGLTRQPGTGDIWSVEHGSSRDDEVNVIEKKGNYGWNPVPRKKGDPSYNEGSNSPMTDYAIKGTQQAAAWRSRTPTVATSGAAFLTGSQWGPFDGSLAVAELKGKALRLLTFDASNKLTSEVVPAELDDTYGRLRGVEVGPDGALYVTTSNGSDDKILKITPAGR